MMYTASVSPFSYDPCYEDYPSSPAASSSPAPCIDSSPPSSPTRETTEFNHIDLTPRNLHPLAGSAKANRTPREYERKPSRYDSTPPSSPIAQSPHKRQRLYDPDGDSGSYSISEDDIDPLPQRIAAPKFACVDNTESAWDGVIDEAVIYGHGHIDLSNEELTYIPAKIKDLSHFTALKENPERINSPVVASKARPFLRIKSVPVKSSKDFFSSNSTRTRSIDDVAMGASRQAIYLYLHNNSIKRIPMELFAVKKLEVLSLRGNALEHIPPEIFTLGNLTELNLSNNKLRFLPAEIRQMKLKQLFVTPNPFLKPEQFNFLTKECSSQTLVTGTTRLERVVSLTRPVFPTVVKLTELCLRLLMSPDPKETIPELPLCLNHTYSWSLDGFSLPPGSDIGNILQTYMPRLVTGSLNVPPAAIHSSFSPTERLPFTDLGICPSPGHTEPAYFVQHTEERMTWEDKVAGVPMTELVPLLWRGCQHGCLQFLTEEEESRDEDRTLADEEDEDTEFEDGEYIQPKEIHFSGVLDGDDFTDFDLE